MFVLAYAKAFILCFRGVLAIERWGRITWNTLTQSPGERHMEPRSRGGCWFDSCRASFAAWKETASLKATT